MWLTDPLSATQDGGFWDLHAVCNDHCVLVSLKTAVAVSSGQLRSCLLTDTCLAETADGVARLLLIVQSANTNHKHTRQV